MNLDSVLFPATTTYLIHAIGLNATNWEEAREEVLREFGD